MNNGSEVYFCVRNLYLFFFILILFFCTGFSESVIDTSILYQPNVEKLELIFKYFMPIKNGVIYTKVPRGLIVSIDEGVFFNSHEARIKESSLYILDTIAILLSKLPNYCVIENHTEEVGECGDYAENWELSIARAQNIAEYMSIAGNLPQEKVFSIGFGEFMPFKDNVSSTIKGFDNRVDFVLIEYDVKR